MKYLFSLAAISFSLLIFSQCQQENSQIVDREEVSVFLKDYPDLQSQKKEIQFWSSRYEEDTIQYLPLLKMAGVYSTIFDKSGRIETAKKAESALLTADRLTAGREAGIKRAIARNMITQHRFQEANKYIDEALELGENRRASTLIKFDVLMELGEYAEAKQIITGNSDFGSSTDYLIRLAKYKDFAGDLDKTVELLELCNSKEQNLQTKIWLSSNLGDFYGHQGNIKASYQAYLKTLELDPGNWYALKGLAWIAYSHDRNADLAADLLVEASKRNQSPSLRLLQAEVESFRGNEELAEGFVESFQIEIKDPGYGVMYRTYQAEILAESPETQRKAVELAEKEVEARPSLETYDLLAWCHYQAGDLKIAKEIADTKLWNKTGEPGVLLHLYEIYSASGETDKAKNLKDQVQQSFFELGPLTADRVGRSSGPTALI